jgi:hypothetical protein
MMCSIMGTSPPPPPPPTRSTFPTWLLVDLP